MNKNTFFDQFTPEQLRSQYAKNALQLEQMAAQAKRTGKPLNGYTAEKLASLAADYRKKSVCAS